MKNRKGFTIVELVIVIAVIAVLAAVLIPTFSGVINKANESAALQTARSSLTNCLNMSSTAQLSGITESKVQKTVFIVDGYAFGYTGNQLEQINYPGYKSEAQLKSGATKDNDKNFNSIIIAAENLIAKGTAVASAPADWATEYTNYYKIVDGAYEKVTGDSAPAFAADTFYATNDTFEIKAAIWNIINVNGDGNTGSKGVSDLDSAINTVKVVKGNYYLNLTASDEQGNPTTYSATVYLNSDLSNKVVCFTTFGS